MPTMPTMPTMPMVPNPTSSAALPPIYLPPPTFRRIAPKPLDYVAKPPPKNKIMISPAPQPTRVKQTPIVPSWTAAIDFGAMKTLDNKISSPGLQQTPVLDYGTKPTPENKISSQGQSWTTAIDFGAKTAPVKEITSLRLPQTPANPTSV